MPKKPAPKKTTAPAKKETSKPIKKETKTAAKKETKKKDVKTDVVTTEKKKEPEHLPQILIF